jgi:hypothetical protein
LPLPLWLAGDVLLEPFPLALRALTPRPAPAPLPLLECELVRLALVVAALVPVRRVVAAARPLVGEAPLVALRGVLRVAVPLVPLSDADDVAFSAILKTSCRFGCFEWMAYPLRRLANRRLGLWQASEGEGRGPRAVARAVRDEALTHDGLVEHGTQCFADSFAASPAGGAPAEQIIPVQRCISR